MESVAVLDSLEVQKARNYKKLEFATAYKIVTRLQNRVTFAKIVIGFSAQKIAYLNWKKFLKQGLRILERESAILRPEDGCTGDFITL